MFRIERYAFAFAAVSTRTARLLVVTLKTFGYIVVYHESHVGLVYSHSEGYRGHYHIHLFHQELVLVLRTRLGIQTGVIGQRLDAVDNQQLRQIFHTLARQAIYNSTLA